MVRTKELTVCVIDTGWYADIAVHLAHKKEFKKVYYCNVFIKSSFPNAQDGMIGGGIEGLTVIHDFWDYVNSIDLFVFPDVLQGDIQLYLRSIGKAVFGCGKGEELELYRWSARGLMEQMDIPVVNAVRVCGVEALKEYLRDKEDKWIKISYYRGVGETRHHINYSMSEPFFFMLQHKLGPLAEKMYFIIEDSVPGIEPGTDTFCINGKYPEIIGWGYEKKGVGYIGKAEEYKNVSKLLTDQNDKLEPFFNKVSYKGAQSWEIRIAEDGVAYPTDFCSRFGCPPHACEMEAIENFGEVLWNVANGIVPQVKYKYKYFVELLLFSEEAKEDWIELIIPDEIKDNVKLRFPFQDGGLIYSVPNQYHSLTIGSIISGDNDLQKAMDKVNEIAGKIQGQKLEYMDNAMASLMEETKKGEKYGLKF